MAKDTDPEFQRACDGLVRQHVYGCVSSLISDITTLLCDPHPRAQRALVELDREATYDWYASLDRRGACTGEGIVFRAQDSKHWWEWNETCHGFSSALEAAKGAASRIWFPEQTGDQDLDDILSYWGDCEATDLTDAQIAEAFAEEGIEITEDSGQYAGGWLYHFSDPEHHAEGYRFEDVLLDAWARIEPDIDDATRDERTCEVYEHWAVSPWLASHLRSQGEETFDLDGLCVWKRCTTGQSISMDWVIQVILNQQGSV